MSDVDAGTIMDRAEQATRLALFAALQAALSGLTEMHYLGRSYEVALQRIDQALTVGAPYGSPEHLASLRGEGSQPPDTANWSELGNR